MIHFCAVFILIDLILILVSFCVIMGVKKLAIELIDNPKFKEYNPEASNALGDILYLPQEFESDDGEEEF